MTFISSTKLTLVLTAPIGKHFDDLNSVLALIKYKFHIIGISEHKIHKIDVMSISNIHMVVQGFSLVFKKWDDLKFNSPG